MKTLKFALYVAPDGEVYESSASEAKIAKKVCRAFSDDDEFEEIELDPGGMIVMSTDVNVDVGKGFLSWAKGFTRKWFQRAMKDQMVDKTMMKLLKERGVETGWSVGRLFRGRYVNPKTEESFNEKSFSVDMRGVTMKFVNEAARRLAKKFDQHSVLVVDHSTGRPKLVIRK